MFHLTYKIRSNHCFVIFRQSLYVNIAVFYYESVIFFVFPWPKRAQRSKFKQNQKWFLRREVKL